LYVSPIGKEAKEGNQAKITSKHKWYPPKKVKNLIRSKYFPGYDTFSIIMELFLILVSLGSFIIPIVYPIILVYEKRDPWHRIFAQVAGIRLKMHVKFIPFLIFIWFMVNFIANSSCLLLSTGIFYLVVCKGWLSYLPKKLRVNKLNVGAGYNQRGKYDRELIQSYRKLQVTSKIANVIYRKPLAASHHGVLMFMALLSVFALVRLHQELNTITYIAVCAAVVITLMIPVVEFKVIATVSVCAIKFLKGLKKRSMRNTGIGKTVLSLPIIRMEIGKPFYLIQPHTIIFAMDLLMQFLIDALMSIPA